MKELLQYLPEAIINFEIIPFIFNDPLFEDVTHGLSKHKYKQVVAHALGQTLSRTTEEKMPDLCEVVKPMNESMSKEELEALVPEYVSWRESDLGYDLKFVVLPRLEELLYFSVDHKNHVAAKALLRNGADVESNIPLESQYSADDVEICHLAAAIGDLEMVKYIIENHGPKFGRGFFLRGMLYPAVEYLCMNVLRYLVEEAGVNIHADYDGIIDFAHDSANEEAVEYLQAYHDLHPCH